MSWYRPKKRATPYNDNLVWGNDNNVRFLVKANEQKDSFKNQIKSPSPTKSVQQKTTVKKEKLKKKPEKSPPSKKKVSFKKETVKNKTGKKTERKKKNPKNTKEVPTPVEKVTKDNFV